MALDWANERYVRVYTRDTPDWQAFSFEAQGLLVLIMRKLDRTRGSLPLGRQGKRGVAIALGHPHRWDVIEPALEELLADGCMIIDDQNVLRMRNFVAAQEVRASAAQRKRDQRERDRARALDDAADVERDCADEPPAIDAEADSAASTGSASSDQRPRPETPSGNHPAVSHAVTRSHAQSHAVTPCRAVPYRTVLFQEPETDPPKSPQGGDVPARMCAREEQPAPVTQATETAATATLLPLPLGLTSPRATSPADEEQPASVKQAPDAPVRATPPPLPLGLTSPPAPSPSREEQPAPVTQAPETAATAKQPPLPLGLTSPPGHSAKPLRGKTTPSQRRVVDRHRASAEEVLTELNAARKRVRPIARGIEPSYESLLHIAERLEAGKTVADCIHVVAVCEAECRAHRAHPDREDPFRFFNAVSPFRPMNFERNLADEPRSPPPTVGAARKHKPADGGAKPVTREVEIT